MEDNRPKIEPSDRSRQIKEYYFSKKLKEVDAMRRSGADIINLGIGSPDLPPSESTINVLYKESLNPANHGYQSYIGIPELRRAFSEWYKKYFKTELDPESEILPLIGSKEGVMHISMAYVNPGDKVLVPNPGYPTYSSAAKLAGAQVVNYNLTEDNSWFPDFDEIEKNGVDGVKLMWVNYPHMPTGQKATKDVFAKLIKFAYKHNILICNDNPYSFILNDEHLSILTIEGAKDVAMELNSLSKSHNMPGWRVGMVAGKKEFIENVLRVKSNMDSGMFRPLQLAASEALACNDEWYLQINSVYEKRRKKAETILNLLGCSYDKNQTGLFLWGKVHEKYSGGEELSDILLYKANIFITPGIIFGSQGDKYIRISLCADEAKLDKTIDRIEKIL